MKPIELKEAIEKLTGRDSASSRGVSIPRLCDLTVSTKELDDPTHLRQSLEDYKPIEGWVCWQSAVTYFQKGDLTYPEEEWLLYGEMAKPGSSLHIRENGEGGWLVTQVDESENPDSGDFAVTTTDLLGESNRAPKNLCYHIFWQDIDRDGFRQVSSRFCGFTKEASQ